MIINTLFKRAGVSSAVLLVLASCASPTAITEQSRSINAPSAWQNEQLTQQHSPQITSWLSAFDNATLNKIVQQALAKNYQLKAQRVNVLLAKERVNVSGALDFPELSLAINNSRRKVVSGDSTNYANSADVNLQLSYEVDLWGKLSAEQSQSQLNFAAAKALYEQQELDLIAEVTRAWFNLVQARQLLALYRERASNLEKNLDIIQSSYRLGLSEALDVYLTQNEVKSELARVESQQQIVSERARQLELLIGDYPNAEIFAGVELPKIDDEIMTGLPADILTNRYDIKSSWFELLALDNGLAVAHKQRFPSFTISASTGDSGSELSELLSGNALAWSLIGNITTPLFNAGRLASLEEQARLAVVQREQQYLDAVYQAFAQVENGISNQQSLRKRFDYISQAEANALAAEKLAFEQYIKGLVSYTTVLESQRRAFDAQTSVIQLSNELLQNRIDLYIALGGQALSDTNESDTQNAEHALNDQISHVSSQSTSNELANRE